MIQLDAIIHHIETETGHRLSNYRTSTVSGGSINTTLKLYNEKYQYFIKLNQAHLLAMFEAEARGLQEIAALNVIRVPDIVCTGQTSSHSYLVLEHIELKSLRQQSSAEMGTQLAKMHQHQQAFFGWHIDNTIGSTPQYNSREHDWLSFWQQHRLGPQLKFAAENGYTGRLQDKGQQLLSQLSSFFEDYHPQPCLLHGDLWAGNAASDPLGNPVIFDPACYYGDRETDIAMTELFGGFDSDFYSAYQAEYPLDPQYKNRKILYNLYHILNHLNLFGDAYLQQSESIIEQLLQVS